MPSTRLDRARWTDVERAYQDARDRPPEARAAFLDHACPDPDVRREVESLLRNDADSGEFLERPALEEAAKAMVFERRPIEPGRRVAGYEIVAWLDAGGMGDVYRARDLRLDRDVALKIVSRDDVLDPTYLARLENEARAASTLSHPNIVTIHGVGEDEDLAYIAMELVSGRTLREVLAAGPLPIERVLELSAQLASALAAAHEAGIVHRDLKPENVMVTPSDLVKVLDFGIARRGRVGESESELAFGTAGYMAPEQTAGRPTTFAADQFSFGAIVYEMACGQRPFHRATGEATRRAVVAEAPVPLRQVRPDASAHLGRIVERCLAKTPEDRYRSTQALAADVQRARDEARRDAIARPTRRRAIFVVGASLVATAAGATAWSLSRGPRAKSLAVLPFMNVDRNPGIDYLCDGLTDVLIRRLSLVSALDVRPRSSVSNFGKTGTVPVEAGRRLRVDAVLAGSIRMHGGRLTVAARFLDVASGETLWEDQYDRPATDLTTLQDELARAIVVEGVRQPLRGDERRALDRPVTDNPAANDAYLRGVFLHGRGTEEDYADARLLLQQAVKEDPAFSLAWVSLASSYSAMAVDGFERPNDAWPESNRAVRRALELDATLPEAHAEQASSWFFFDRDWSAAEIAWKRALASRASPALPDLLTATAMKLWALRRGDEAMSLARRARTLDPVSPRFVTLEADLALSAGRTSDAIGLYSAALASSLDHAAAWFGLAEAHRARGEFDRAVEARRRAHETVADPLPDALVARAGPGNGEAAYLAIERFAAEREAEALRARAARGAYVSPLDVARAHVRLGDAAAAFEALDQAFADRAPGLVFLNVDRAWTNVKDDARFKAAVRAVGLP